MVHVKISVGTEAATEDKVGSFGGEGLVLGEFGAVISGIDGVVGLVAAVPGLAVFADDDGFAGTGGITVGVAFGVEMFELVDAGVGRLQIGVVHDGAALEIVNV